MFAIPNKMIDALCVHVSIFVGSDEQRDFKKRENEPQKIGGAGPEAWAHVAWANS